MTEYFELLEDEEQYLKLLQEGALKTGALGVAGGLVGRGVATKIAAKSGMSAEKAKKLQNVATAGGAALGVAAAKTDRIRRAIQAKKAEKEVALEGLGRKLATVGGGVAGYYTGKKLKLGSKGQAAATATGALVGHTAAKSVGKAKERDKELKQAYKDRLKAKAAIQKQAQQAMKQRRQQYTSEDESISEDTFAKITARSIGKYAGKAKERSDAIKKAKDRAAAFAKAMKQWKKEGY